LTIIINRIVLSWFRAEPDAVSDKTPLYGWIE